jgi:hypothetical protein
MKIVATVTNVDSVVNCGGNAESRSAIIDIPDSLLPSLVLEYLANQKLAKEDKSYKTYNNLTFSILEEDTETGGQND